MHEILTAIMISLMSTSGSVCEHLADGVVIHVRSLSTGNSMFVDTATWGLECNMLTPES